MQGDSTLQKVHQCLFLPLQGVSYQKCPMDKNDFAVQANCNQLPVTGVCLRLGIKETKWQITM